VPPLPLVPPAPPPPSPAFPDPPAPVDAGPAPPLPELVEALGPVLLGPLVDEDVEALAPPEPTVEEVPAVDETPLDAADVARACESSDSMVALQSARTSMATVVAERATRRVRPRVANLCTMSSDVYAQRSAVKVHKWPRGLELITHSSCKLSVKVSE